jgi:hypothetical protein
MSDRDQLIEECKVLYLKNKDSKKIDWGAVDQLELRFSHFVKAENCDTEILIYQILSSYLIMMSKFDEIIEETKKRKQFNKQNFNLVILIAYLEDAWMGGINDDTFSILLDMQENDPRRQAVIEILKAWYFKGNDEGKYISALENACRLDSTIPQPFIELGCLCIKRSETVYGKKLIERGLAKIKRVDFDRSPALIALDIEEFIDSLIKGNSSRETIYKNLRDMIIS